MEQVGRYQILEELGRGAHGIVYKALDPAISRTVAIKSIALGNVDSDDRERVRDGILREARSAGTLSHPNIVTVYDVQDDGENAYIFMEYVDGMSLEWILSATRGKRSDGLNRVDFLLILRQIAGALDYAHRKGVIHRDVKPANIVVTGRRPDVNAPASDVQAKIADFGVAKFISPEVTQSLTGTPNYMSPEQVQGAVLTGASDQFSLAVIAYEILCGRKAFAADTVEALLYKIRNEREMPVDSLNQSLSPTVRKVMEGALSKDPAQRFSNCSEFAGALEFALGDSPNWTPGVAEAPRDPRFTIATTFDPLEPDEEKSSRGRRFALITGLGIAVILAIVAIVRMNSGPPVPTQVLDTRNAPVSPPPAATGTSSVEEFKEERRPRTIAIPPPAAKESPTVVKVPVPEVAPAKKVSKLQIARNNPAPAVSPGLVNLLSDPPGASILVDGRSSCVAPCSLSLPNGRHTLVAGMNGFGSSRKIFNLPKDTSVFIPMVKSLGVLIISSSTTGANVNVDGHPAGATPLTLRLTPGVHKISVWDGANWHDQTVSVAADEVSTRTFQF